MRSREKLLGQLDGFVVLIATLGVSDPRGEELGFDCVVAGQPTLIGRLIGDTWLIGKCGPTADRNNSQNKRSPHVRSLVSSSDTENSTWIADQDKRRPKPRVGKGLGVFLDWLFEIVHGDG